MNDLLCVVVPALILATAGIGVLYVGRQRMERAERIEKLRRKHHRSYQVPAGNIAQQYARAMEKERNRMTLYTHTRYEVGQTLTWAPYRDIEPGEQIYLAMNQAGERHLIPAYGIAVATKHLGNGEYEFRRAK